VCVPVIGVLIGGAFTPDALAQIPGWWPGLVGVAVFAPLAQGAAWAALRRGLKFDPATAWFGAMPGGLIEAVEMGGANGADLRALTVIQFGRIALVVTLVPLLFWWMQGEAVGSAAGVAIAPPAPLGPVDAALLIGAGWIGYAIGRRLRLPAGQITGPLLLSAALHGAGWTAASPPAALVALAQLVIGTGLGCRFAGLAPGLLARGMAGAAAAVAAMLGVGAALAAILAAVGHAPFPVAALALAPGGVVEMGLIALSLEASPIFVTAHHLARILLTVGFASWAWRRFEPR
jgi:membrane AbrB-like protein